MLKKLLEKQAVFSATLKFLAFFAQRPAFGGFTRWATGLSARLNVSLNKPAFAQTPAKLAETWQALMPPDGKQYFPVTLLTEDTAYTEIHVTCPLRGTGHVAACHKLMHYDRELMRKVGGELIVLESQSNSGKDYCRLAIRPQGKDTSDLKPAFEKD
ncbi:MAG: hypothetical protein AAFR61_07760 [Bacteroidota bacterium]